MNFFDKNNNIRFPILENGMMYYKEEDGSIVRIDEKDRKFSSEPEIKFKLNKRVIDYIVEDPLNTKVRRSCKCGNDIAAISRKNNTTYIVCCECKAVYDTF